MDGDWLTGLQDELAAARAEAAACADACDALLLESRDVPGAERQQLLRALIVPTAIARIFADREERPAAVVVAAARVCCDSCLHAIHTLDALALPEAESAAARVALRRASDACARLLRAAGAG